MDAQMIVSPSGERLVVLSEADYVALVTAAEDALDGKVVDAFRRDLANGVEELIPSEVVARILHGENRIKIWREYRGLTAAALAERAGTTQELLSQLEDGTQIATSDTLEKMAAALRIATEDLITPHRDASTRD